MTDVHNDAVRRLATGEWTGEDFRAHIREVGVPLIDRISATEVLATFVHESADDVEVELLDLVGYHPAEPRRLARVGTSNWRTFSLVLRSDLRFSYGFEILDGTEAGQLAADPLNPPPPTTDPRLRASVATMPDAAALPWQPTPDAPTPAMDELSFHSTALDNDRTVWVSSPPGWSPQAEPYRFVVLFDGTPGHTAPAVRDDLVRDGRIEPCVVILVDQIGIRDRELTCNPAFSQMLVTELLPRLRERYHLSEDPQHGALSGSSFGGLCAGWTALHHPEVFGNAIMQSPSCWYVSADDQAGAPVTAEALRHVPRTPSLIKAFRERDPQPVRIFHEVGAIEWAPPMGKLRGPFGNRWLDDILTLKGYSTRYREYPGGHDALWWRATWAEALEWTFGISR